MKRFLASALVLIAAAALPLQAGPQGEPGPGSPDEATRARAILDRSEFGIWYTDPRGEQVLAPTTLVPLEPGTEFGWRIRILHPADTVTITERLTLPSAPRSWGNIDSSVQSISRDRRSCVTTTRAAGGGWYVRSWSVAEGDPAGEHRITVQVNARTVATYRFWVLPRPRPTE